MLSNESKAALAKFDRIMNIGLLVAMTLSAVLCGAAALVF